MFESPKIQNEELKIVPEEKIKGKTNENRRRSTKYQHKNKAKLKYPPKKRNTKRLTKATAIKETEGAEFIPIGNEINNQKPKRKSFKLKSKAEKNKSIVPPQIDNLKTNDEINKNKNQ